MTVKKQAAKSQKKKPEPAVKPSPGDIRVECETLLYIPFQELHPIQGSLKKMPKENFDALRKTIIEDGIDFAFHVWREGITTKWWIIDGHGRELVLEALNKEGYGIPEIPCVETYATTMEKAKRKVLRSSSTYNLLMQSGLIEFAEGAGITLEELKVFPLPGLERVDFLAVGNGATASKLSLADRFLVPPFSVLDARQGYWQERKRQWLDLGIQSEIGRGGG